MKLTTKSIARAAIIAALYTLLTVLFQAISFREIQFRVSEALTLLPILTLEAVPGLAIGCLISNLVCGAPWFDIVFGAIATLLAAICTYRLRGKPLVAAAMPVLFNGIIVGPIVYFAYMLAPGAQMNVLALLGCMATVMIGEAAVCYILGIAFVKALQKLPDSLWD